MKSETKRKRKALPSGNSKDGHRLHHAASFEGNASAMQALSGQNGGAAGVRAPTSGETGAGGR
jgi:hypothetical protein